MLFHVAFRSFKTILKKRLCKRINSFFIICSMFMLIANGYTYFGSVLFIAVGADATIILLLLLF